MHRFYKEWLGRNREVVPLSHFIANVLGCVIALLYYNLGVFKKSGVSHMRHTAQSYRRFNLSVFFCFDVDGFFVDAFDVVAATNYKAFVFAKTCTGRDEVTADDIFFHAFE